MNRDSVNFQHECTEQTEVSNDQLEGGQRGAEGAWFATHLARPEHVLARQWGEPEVQRDGDSVCLSIKALFGIPPAVRTLPLGPF